MHVIIFSIDKNYELYQELEEGVEMEVFKLKKFQKIPLAPLKRGNHSLASPNHQL